jgi:tetratricopeptide (TPR) repeat protein
VALAAVEGDSAAAVRLQLERRVREASDPAAELGLAYLALYSYDYQDADRRFESLRDGSPAEEPVGAYARLGLAQSALARGQVARGDTLIGSAVLATRAAKAPVLETEALLLQSLAAARLRGPASAESSLVKAERLLPQPATWLGARATCVRAQLTTSHDLARAAGLALEGAQRARAAGALRPEGYCLFVAAGAIGNQGNGDSSLVLFGQAASVQGKARDRAGRAATLQWMGYAFYDQGSYGESRRALTEALADGQASGNMSPVAWGHMIFAMLVLATGELDAIAPHADAAESLFMRNGDAIGAVALANFEVQRARVVGDTARARAAAERFAAGADRYGWHWPVFAQRELAFVEMDAGNWAAAARHLDRARVRARTLGAKALELSVEQDVGILLLREGNPRAAHTILSRVVSQIPPSEASFRHYTLTQMALAQLRLGEVDRAAATALSAADELDHWRAGLDDRRLRQTAFDLRRFEDPSFAVADVVTGLAAAGRTEAAFELAERRRARNLLDRIVLAQGMAADPGRVPRSSATVISAGDIATRIPDDATVIVEFVRGSRSAPTVAFLLARAGLRAVILPPDDGVQRRAQRLIGLLEAGAPADSLARELGEELVAPLLEAMPPTATRLVLVPDLDLHGLPFEVLQVEGQPLVERFSVSYAPSASVLARLWERPRGAAGATLLAFGDPQYAGETDPGSSAQVLRSAFDRNGGLPRLRGSAREVRRVARYADQAVVRLREQASEADLKREPLGRYRVIHLATHALVDDRSPARTALALTPGQGEDGFVSPAEVSALGLDADLLVLSGCRTARGEVAGGEGVGGLAAPAIEAGARAVLASGWLVGDRQSAGFMERFYGHLASGLTLGDALRETKLELRRGGVPPAVWASFTLLGDPLARIPLHAPAPGIDWPLELSALVLLALALYGVIRMRRRGGDASSTPSGSSATTTQR